MNKSVVIILAGAICTAFIVAFSVQAFLTSDEPAESSPAMALTQILVADQSIAEGAVVEADKLRWADWPESAVLPGAFVQSAGTDIADLSIIGQTARRDIERGEPVLPAAVVSLGAGSFLAARIEPGMLAFSIPVSPSSSVGGFARPGDHVDVILTSNLRISSSEQKRTQGYVQRYSSETILRDLRVLAVDQTAQDEDREAQIGKVVTLEVSQKGAEVLALALEMGEITLALRRLGDAALNSTDAEPAPTTDVGVSRTLQNLNKLQQAQGIDGGSPGMNGGASTTTILIYRGGDSERITVPLSRQSN